MILKRLSALEDSPEGAAATITEVVEFYSLSLYVVFVF